MNACDLIPLIPPGDGGKSSALQRYGNGDADGVDVSLWLVLSTPAHVVP